MGFDDINRLEQEHDNGMPPTITAVELAACIPGDGNGEDDHAHINVFCASQNAFGEIETQQYNFVLSLDMLDQFAMGISDVLMAVANLKAQRMLMQGSTPIGNLFRAMQQGRNRLEQQAQPKVEDDEPDVGPFKYL